MPITVSELNLEMSGRLRFARVTGTRNIRLYLLD
jgi:hypothetical protein